VHATIGRVSGVEFECIGRHSDLGLMETESASGVILFCLAVSLKLENSSRRYLLDQIVLCWSLGPKEVVKTCQFQVEFKEAATTSTAPT